MARAQRRTSFGGVAPLYDRARPSYPPELIDDVIGLAPMADDPRALEVGAGTGKATVLFAARGVAVHALEPLPEMAALAERNCAAYPDVTIERVEFERWERRQRCFPLLYSAQAWHWIEPGTRYSAARAALEPGGLLAAFWNRPDWDRCPLREALEHVYARSAPDLAANGPMRPSRWLSTEVWSRWGEEIEPTDRFEQPEVRTYEFVATYSTAEYVELLQTHSDHIVLEAGQRQALLEGIAAVIGDAGGVLELTYATHLCLARAV
jgi:SAM-dependent methyltransferase